MKAETQPSWGFYLFLGFEFASRWGACWLINFKWIKEICKYQHNLSAPLLKCNENPQCSDKFRLTARLKISTAICTRCFISTSIVSAFVNEVVTKVKHFTIRHHCCSHIFFYHIWFLRSLKWIHLPTASEGKSLDTDGAWRPEAASSSHVTRYGLSFQEAATKCPLMHVCTWNSWELESFSQWRRSSACISNDLKPLMFVIKI